MSKLYRRFVSWLMCKLFDHDDHINKVYYKETQFVSLGMCTRCNRQWWMWGEEGRFLGVRFIVTEEKE